MFNQYKIKLFFVFILATSLILTSFGCTLRTTVPESSLPIVYTTIYPLYDFTKKIGGDKITIINITPAGAEPHSFEPTSKLLADISKADLFLYNGAGMEPYLDNLLTTLQGSSPLMINANQGVTLIKENEMPDPHTWLSPSCALTIGENILQALIQIDPENTAFYEKNFQSFQDKITELIQDYKNTLAQCEKRKIIVTHQAFNYLCHEYNLEQIPIMGLNAEAEPSSMKLKEICQLIHNEKIKYLFTEALFSPKVAETIAAETGATVLQLHPLGSLSEKEIQEGKDYFKLMRENLKNLQLALEYKP
ncbi:MAG: zinc ABC transporter solute-binding protein [Clostridia bacterium]|jgi:zinc transport system substrate-binding protein|nr:zinc ABC transporter solute-binding protein [Clostridia bacterium]